MREFFICGDRYYQKFSSKLVFAIAIVLLIFIGLDHFESQSALASIRQMEIDIVAPLKARAFSKMIANKGGLRSPFLIS